MRGGGILGVLVLVWLLIGVVAAYQREMMIWPELADTADALLRRLIAETAAERIA